MITYEQLLNEIKSMTDSKPTTTIDVAWRAGYLAALHLVLNERTLYGRNEIN